MENVKKEYQNYIQQSGVKADIADMMKDAEALEAKLIALKDKIIQVNNHDYVKKYIDAGYANWHPELTNLHVAALAEYKELQNKLKQLKL